MIKNKKNILKEEIVNNLSKPSIVNMLQFEATAPQKSGIKGFDERIYQNFNLIIGENGAGKTRFLNEMKDYYKQKNFSCIFLDFSQASLKINCSSDNMINPIDALNIEPSPLDSEYTSESDLISAIIYNENIEGKTDDFLAFVGGNLVSFFDELSYLLSNKITQKRVNSIFQEIKNLVLDLLKYKIELSNGELFLVHAETQRSLKVIDLVGEMSPGERSLLLAIFSILSMSIKNDHYILLIDEPETHLHPLAQIKLVNFFQNYLHKEKIFIATHSIFLLPQVKFEEIVYLENGEIKPFSSKMYENIISKLVGNEENVPSIYSLISSAHYWTYSQFLAECFCVPLSYDEAKTTDIQYLNLNQTIDNLFNKKNYVKVLDYGAGSGRIAKCMAMDSSNESKNQRKGKMLYYVYDKHETPKDLPDVEWLGGIIRNEKELLNYHAEFDVIVLFNVLHEIGIDEWKSQLNIILDLLANDGIIIFSERKVLSKGEFPYGKSGYLILNTREIEILFSNSLVRPVNLNSEMKDPTICAIIEKNTKTLVTEQSIFFALKALYNRSWSKINYSMNNKALGREYAFYCQQFINAKHALNIINELFKKTDCIEDNEQCYTLLRQYLKKDFTDEDIEELIGYTPSYVLGEIIECADVFCDNVTEFQKLEFDDYKEIVKKYSYGFIADTCNFSAWLHSYDKGTFKSLLDDEAKFGEILPNEYDARLFHFSR